MERLNTYVKAVTEASPQSSSLFGKLSGWRSEVGIRTTPNRFRASYLGLATEVAPWGGGGVVRIFLNSFVVRNIGDSYQKSLLF